MNFISVSICRLLLCSHRYCKDIHFFHACLILLDIISHCVNSNHNCVFFSTIPTLLFSCWLISFSQVTHIFARKKKVKVFGLMLSYFPFLWGLDLQFQATYFAVWCYQITIFIYLPLQVFKWEGPISSFSVARSRSL